MDGHKDRKRPDFRQRLIAVVGEITPVAQRRALLAIATAVNTWAGLLAPYVMGNVVERAATPPPALTA